MIAPREVAIETGRALIRDAIPTGHEPCRSHRLSPHRHDPGARKPRGADQACAADLSSPAPKPPGSSGASCEGKRNHCPQPVEDRLFARDVKLAFDGVSSEEFPAVLAVDTESAAVPGRRSLRTVTGMRRLGTNAKVIGLVNVPGKLGISGLLAPTIRPAITTTLRGVHAGGGWLDRALRTAQGPCRPWTAGQRLARAAQDRYDEHEASREGVPMLMIFMPPATSARFAR